MLKSFYKNIVFKYPFVCVLFLLALISFLGYQAKNLEIDASAQTLLLEDDTDLKFATEVSKRYTSSEILVVAFSPKDELFAESTLQTIDSISKEFVKLKEISSVTSILNAPLLQSPVQPISQLVGNVPTLLSKQTDRGLAKQEFLTSPIYKNNIVSSDFKTTALVLNLAKDDEVAKLKKELKKLSKGSLEYTKKKIEIKTLRDKKREKNHLFIKQVRSIIASYSSSGDMFLGGVNMIADDMVTYIKSDLKTYGTALLVLLIFVLWVIFKELRFVILPIIICLSSIICTTGILGLFGWEVTVISSNFISLQLIITISIILHLIVRYREVALNSATLSQKELVLETLLSKASPSFFAIITTIVGFGSLALSNILPIMNLGWMMSSGIFISLILAFLIFPIVMLHLKKTTPKTSFEHSFSLTQPLAKLVEFHGNKVIFFSIAIALFSFTGASRLMVENSFINYFKSDTPIYQGMEAIDSKLGGTTPLDVIVKFKDKEETIQEISIESEEDGFDDFADEFEKSEDEAQYWFTSVKMKKIEQIHDYLTSIKTIGNVQSLATILKIGRTLNENRDLDNFQLALLYNEIPENYRKILLDAYVNIEENEVRFATRIVDSNPKLRRAELLEKIENDLADIINDDYASYRLSNLMVMYNNMLQSLFDSQIKTLGFVIISLFIMFLLIFKSIKIATLSMISNLIPMSIIFGFMGWFEIPLDLMTITIAAISLGIGVDDTIHYVHRYLEELEIDGNHIEAMKRSHNSIGYAMYYTTFAIILGFSILVFSNFIPTIYFGLLTVLVMFMALLGAMLLLPRLFILFKIKA